MQAGDGAYRVLPSMPRRSSNDALTTSNNPSVLTDASTRSPWGPEPADSTAMAAADGMSVQVISSIDVAESAVLGGAPVAIPAQPSRKHAAGDELRFANCNECSLDSRQGGAEDAANWLILRSIDDSEAAMLMSEGDALCFGESDAWRRQEQEAAELLPRPAWRHSPAVTVLGDSQGLNSKLMPAAGSSRQLCSVLDVVAQAVAPVKKLCDVVGVELVLLSSSLLVTVNKLLGGSSGVAALPGGGSDSAVQPSDTLISVASADSAARAISHVLDASLQRVRRKGRVLVDIYGGSEMKVQVLIADTGREMLSDLTGVAAFGDDASDVSRGTACRQTAQDAIERMSIGLPVGGGVMGIQIAERLLQENGASVTVGSWMFKDEEYVGTTVTFQAGAELSL